MTKKQIAHIALTGAMIAAVAVPALAQNTTPPGGSMTATAKPKAKALNIACVAAAVDKRDTAIASVFDMLKNAVMTRKDALKAAWSQTDAKARRAAIHAAWKAYATSVSSARSTRKAAWTAFYADRKACGPGAAAEDATTQAVDQNL